MREDILNELENEYSQLRAENERLEEMRKEKIRVEQPHIYELTKKRENIVFGTLRNIVNGTASKANDLPEQMEKLNEQIRTLLKKNGYSEDYLAPIYRCSICKDTGKVGELVKENCECLKKQYHVKLRDKIGLSTDKKETFETFDLNVFSDEIINGKESTPRQFMKMYRNICERWSNDYPKVQYRDLVISGSTGLGKTFLLRSMAERLIERDINVLIISAYKMIDLLRKSYFENDDCASELLDVDVLMIDDLGSEPLMQNVTIEQLFNLLNERQNKGLSTVISTNLDMNLFRERYSERIASRVRDSKNCKVLNLVGEDLRIGRNQNK